LTSNDVLIDAIVGEIEIQMRTTVTIDDELLEEAQRLTGIKERATLIRVALETLVQRESARRLARLGGSQPDIKDIPRRRPG
jgi:Arc/MetJ family transcription regulator